jgi:retron-type reverse transcriptase
MTNERSNLRLFYFSDSEIQRAVKQVKKGKKYKGKPKKDLRNYSIEEELKEKNSLGKFFDKEFVNVSILIKSLNDDKYKITPYQAIIIPRKGKKPRPILVPAPKDRIVFTAILRRIRTPLNFLQNEYNIFGSAKHNELPRIKDIIYKINKHREEYRYILKVDIIDFFPSILKEELLLDLSKYIDKYCLNIIRESLYNKLHYVNDAQKYKDRFVKPETNIGIPQGCAYSPLLANFYAREIDDYLKSQNLISFRYLDDLLIFTNDAKHAERIFRNIQRIGKKLNLNYHELNKDKNKSYSAPTSQPFEYLGITITKNGLLIPPEKIEAFITTFKNNFFNLGTIRRLGILKVFNETEPFVKGWANYYSTICPEYFKIVKKEINEKLNIYINKKEYETYIKHYGMNINRILF